MKALTNKNHLKTATCVIATIMLAACGENQQKTKTVDLTNYNRLRYFKGSNVNRNKARQKSDFFNLLFSDTWVAIDQKNGKPFYGTHLKFNISGSKPVFDLTLPDNSPPNRYYNRNYLGEISERTIDDPSLVWTVLKPGPCGMSRLWFDGVTTTSYGTELNVVFHKSCASSYIANQLNGNVESIDIEEEWTFQRVSEVNKRIEAENEKAPTK